MNIYIDSKMNDDARRREIYSGAVFVYAPSPSALELCRLAQIMIEEAFRPFDPLTIHEHLPAEKCAEILATLKPQFIHHPRAKECIRGMLAGTGHDLSQTYFDVPRMRTAFPGDYLKSGIAYAFHPHRDTWYSAPFCQINWWMPVYELNSENCMALHPHYFERAIKNGSQTYNYHRWNLESRHNAAQHVKTDTRVQPRPEEEIELDPQMRFVCDVGGAYQFSAAHLHSTVPNTSARRAIASTSEPSIWAMFWAGSERATWMRIAPERPWETICEEAMVRICPRKQLRCIRTARKWNTQRRRSLRRIAAVGKEGRR